MVSCYIKIAAYESEIRFDPSIPDLGDLAIPHTIVNENKLFKHFYTIHYAIKKPMARQSLLMWHYNQYLIKAC
jgi:hypothetical protein